MQKREMRPSCEEIIFRGLLFAGDHEFRGPEEGAFDLGIREGADGFAGGVGVLMGESGGGVEGSVGGEDFENLRVGDAVKGALFVDRRDASAFFGSATLEGV